MGLFLVSLLCTSCVLLSNANADMLDIYQLTGKNTCQFNYQDAFGFGRINPTHNWICSSTDIGEPYSKTVVDQLLGQNLDFQDFLSITKDCASVYSDPAMNMAGDSNYYQWEGMCKMVRTPVSMIWAKPTDPNIIIPQDFQARYNGYLPVHVLPDQNLYNVECIHPWAGNPKVSDRRLARRLKRIRWTEKKKRLCLYGYMYNYRYICKPTGYMSRYVLVYSPKMHMIFKAQVDDIPTSCVCATCDCYAPSPLDQLGNLGGINIGSVV